MKKIFAVILAIAIAASAFVMIASAKDADTWLCQPGDNYSTGWWMHPIPARDWEFTAKFATPNAFDGLYMAVFACGGTGVTIKIEVLDENDKVVDTVESTIVGDHNTSSNAIEVRLQKAHAAGTYTLRLTPTSQYDNDNAHFVMGSAPAGDITVEIGGNCNTNDATLAAPAILLTGCDAPSSEQPSTPSSSVKPAKLITASELAALVDSAPHNQGVSYEAKDGYLTFTAGHADPWVVFAEPLNVGTENKYAVIKYRTSDSNIKTIDFYLKVAEPHARGDEVTADGEWHYAILNLETPFPENMDSLWDGTIARLDVMNGTQEVSVEGAKLDIAEIAFFASEADVAAYTRGTSNPASGDAAIIAIAAVGCIALAGAAVAKKSK